ncbi:MAG TPA: outer membrane beta-barrel protein [Caulobacteraceae bacterium]
MKQKLGLLVFAGAIAAASAGYAADPSASKDPPATGAPDWTGGYVGVYVGGSDTTTNLQEINGPGELAFLPGERTRTDIDHSAVVYGGFAGYNYQFPNGQVVAGAELEIGGNSGSATGVTNSGVIPNAPPIEDNIPTYNKLALPWTFRARARLGYALGDVLPFVAAGVTVTQAQLDLTFPCPNFPSPGTTVYTANTSKTLTGFNVGAGVDWAITRNLVSRVEYIFDDYGTPSFAENGSQGWNNRRLSALQSNTLRVAIGYKF